MERRLGFLITAVFHVIFVQYFHNSHIRTALQLSLVLDAGASIAVCWLSVTLSDSHSVSVPRLVILRIGCYMFSERYDKELFYLEALRHLIRVKWTF